MLPMGQGAVLLQCSSLAQVMALRAMLRADAAGNPTLSGIRDVVAAARTVLVRCDSPATLERLKRLLAAATLPEQAAATGRLHTLATVYDGDDLQEAARLAGLGPEALRTWHSGQDWVAAFGGFAPGFMYLTPTDRALALPRRDTPRTQVPAGSVAVAGEFSAVYPGPTPGGWQLLGHSTAVLWDAARANPALIQPGDIVRFSPVREIIALSSGTDPAQADPVQAEPAPAPPSQTEPLQTAGSTHLSGQFHGLHVVAPGMFTIVQDLGRPGFAHLGVTGSGALDRAALRRANRMVGNSTGTAATTHATAGATHAAGAAALETVLAGLQLKAAGTHVLAVAGGPVALRVEDEEGDQRPVPLDTPFVLRDGETITLLSAAGDGGFRSYVAVRGGFDLPQVLGSRATDVLSGLGPAPLRPGAFLPVAPSLRGSIVGFPEPAPPPPEDCTVLRYLPGPRQDWFTSESVDSFENQEWGVDGQSNRVGLRLAGTPLVRAGSADGTQSASQTGTSARAEPAPPAELPSEGMVEGALQVPPSGLPVLFLADHPVTGGYPVLGVVLAEDLGKAAQLAPGARVRFIKVPVSSELG